MWYGLGLLVAFLSIAGSVYELKQLPSTYYDVVAVAVVFGGTLAIGFMLLPWEKTRELIQSFSLVIRTPSSDPRPLLFQALGLVRSVSEGSVFATNLKGGAGMILKDGAELIQLGFSSRSIERILVERIENHFERRVGIANSIRGLAKYPPAFGLVGTVLGLVSLMRGISEGATAQETGVRMAIALVATLYGLIVANVLVNPFGERILRYAQEERKASDIAMQAVLLATEGVSVLEAQEVLNSFVPAHQRVNLMRTGGSGGQRKVA